MSISDFKSWLVMVYAFALLPEQKFDLFMLGNTVTHEISFSAFGWQFIKFYTFGTEKVELT